MASREVETESAPAEAQAAAAEEAPKEEAAPAVAEPAPAAEAPKEEKVEDVTGKGEVSPATAFDDTPNSQGVVGENHVVASNPVDQALPSADSQSRSLEDDVEKVVDEEVDAPLSGDIQKPASEEPEPSVAVVDEQIQEAAPEGQDSITSTAIADDTLAAVDSDKTGDNTLNDNDNTTAYDETTGETTGETTVADDVEESHEEDRGTDSDDFVLVQKSDVDNNESTGHASEALAAGVAVAGGSLLATTAVAEAAKESSEDRDEVSQAEVSRDISEGIPTEPSARDLPPYSPSPDAAMTVEPAKKLQSAGSQYGTFQTELPEAQQASQGEDERERSESSASPKLKGVMVKDEGVASKPNPLSTTSGKLTILASIALGVYAVFKLANGGARYP